MDVLERGILSGEVYDRAGDPMRGGQVLVQDPTTFETITLRTAGDGTFRTENLRPGKWQVTAMIGVIDPGADASGADGDVSSFLQNMRFTMADVRAGEETHVVLGAPPADPVVVHGELTHDDEPVGQAVISFLLE